MRESPDFEVRLRRFGVWRAMVAAVALAAVAAQLAWVAGIAASGARVGAAVATAALLIAATIAAAVSLARVDAGTLACRDGAWSFVREAGAAFGGPLTVAIDLGGFLLLCIRTSPRSRLWLPVQRRGLEREWHALRCAVHSPDRRSGVAGSAAVRPPR